VLHPVQASYLGKPLTLEKSRASASVPKALPFDFTAYHCRSCFRETRVLVDLSGRFLSQVGYPQRRIGRRCAPVSGRHRWSPPLFRGHVAAHVAAVVLVDTYLRRRFWSRCSPYASMYHWQTPAVIEVLTNRRIVLTSPGPALASAHTALVAPGFEMRS
jgi:hypothetical protein